MIIPADQFVSFEQVSRAMTFPEFSALAVKYPERMLVPELLSSQSSVRLAAYLWLREVRGCDHRFAVMLALQEAPRAMTDREYMEGRHNWVSDVSGDAGELMKIARRNAAAEGVAPPSDTAVYEPGLADYPLDPKAFVSGGRNELRRKCEARGLDCDGPVKVRAHRQKEVHAGRLGQDIVDNIVANKVRANPDLARKVSRRDLEADVRSEHQFTDKRLYGKLESNPGLAARPAVKVSTKKPKAKRNR